MTESMEIPPELFARLAHPTVRLSGSIDEPTAASFLHSESYEEEACRMHDHRCGRKLFERLRKDDSKLKPNNA